MDDDKLIAEIEAMFKKHHEQAAKYKAMLTAYHTATGNGNGAEMAVKEKKIKEPLQGTTLPVIPSDRGTFEDKVIEILSDGKPRTVHELWMDYKKSTGIDLELKDLSSKLSGRVKYGKINSIHIQQYPRKIRAWWGLATWLESNGKKFKIEYHERIKPAHEVIQELFQGQDIEA